MSSASGRDVEITPISGALGATVRGLDLRHIGETELSRVRAAFLDHLVLFFLDQSLDAAALQTEVEEALDDVNRMMSTYLPDSEISTFNASGSTE